MPCGHTTHYPPIILTHYCWSKELTKHTQQINDWMNITVHASTHEKMIKICTFMSSTNLLRHNVAIHFRRFCSSLVRIMSSHPIHTKPLSLLQFCGIIHCTIRIIMMWIALVAVSIRKTVLPGMAIPMLKIRRPNGRLIFNMEITIRR